MNGEIVILMGPPGSGKTSMAKELFPHHRRINRDDIGGSTTSIDSQIYQMLRTLYRMGERQFVLDNTHPTRQNRSVAIEVAKELDLGIECYWVDIKPGQAQFLAAWRQVQRFGSLPSSQDYKEAEEPWMFPPGAQFRFWKLFEEPRLDEGFHHVEKLDFTFETPKGYHSKALILDYDGTLRVTKSGDKWPTSPEDIEILPGRAEVLKRYKDEGYLLLGASNQSGVSRKPGEKGYLTADMAAACLHYTHEGLGVEFDGVLFAVDRGGPPQTFWRKPHSGMGAVLFEKFKLDPDLCISVGDQTSDATFASRCGFNFVDADSFFG